MAILGDGISDAENLRNEVTRLGVQILIGEDIPQSAGIHPDVMILLDAGIHQGAMIL